MLGTNGSDRFYTTVCEAQKEFIKPNDEISASMYKKNELEDIQYFLDGHELHTLPLKFIGVILQKTREKISKQLMLFDQFEYNEGNFKFEFTLIKNTIFTLVNKTKRDKLLDMNHITKKQKLYAEQIDKITQSFKHNTTKINEICISHECEFIRNMSKIVDFNKYARKILKCAYFRIKEVYVYECGGSIANLIGKKTKSPLKKINNVFNEIYLFIFKISVPSTILTDYMLHEAVVKRNLEFIEDLLSNNGENVIYTHVDKSDPIGVTPLLFAVQLQYVDVISLLLSYKADPKQKFFPSNISPLELAIEQGNIAIMEMLFQAGQTDPINKSEMIQNNKNKRQNVDKDWDKTFGLLKKTNFELEMDLILSPSNKSKCMKYEHIKHEKINIVKYNNVVKVDIISKPVYAQKKKHEKNPKAPFRSNSVDHCININSKTPDNDQIEQGLIQKQGSTVKNKAFDFNKFKNDLNEKDTKIQIQQNRNSSISNIPIDKKLSEKRSFRSVPILISRRDAKEKEESYLKPPSICSIKSFGKDQNQSECDNDNQVVNGSEYAFDFKKRNISLNGSNLRENYQNGNTPLQKKRKKISQMKGFSVLENKPVCSDKNIYAENYKSFIIQKWVSNSHYHYDYYVRYSEDSLYEKVDSIENFKYFYHENDSTLVKLLKGIDDLYNEDIKKDKKFDQMKSNLFKMVITSNDFKFMDMKIEPIRGFWGNLCKRKILGYHSEKFKMLGLEKKIKFQKNNGNNFILNNEDFLSFIDYIQAGQDLKIWPWDNFQLTSNIYGAFCFKSRKFLYKMVLMVMNEINQRGCINESTFRYIVSKSHMAKKLHYSSIKERKSLISKNQNNAAYYISDMRKNLDNIEKVLKNQDQRYGFLNDDSQVPNKSIRNQNQAYDVQSYPDQDMNSMFSNKDLTTLPNQLKNKNTCPSFYDGSNSEKIENDEDNIVRNKKLSVHSERIGKSKYSGFSNANPLSKHNLTHWIDDLNILHANKCNSDSTGIIRTHVNPATIQPCLIKNASTLNTSDSYNFVKKKYVVGSKNIDNNTKQNALWRRLETIKEIQCKIEMSDIHIEDYSSSEKSLVTNNLKSRSARDEQEIKEEQDSAKDEQEIKEEQEIDNNHSVIQKKATFGNVSEFPHYCNEDENSPKLRIVFPNEYFFICLKKQKL